MLSQIYTKECPRCKETHLLSAFVRRDKSRRMRQHPNCNFCNAGMPILGLVLPIVMPVIAPEVTSL